VNRHHLIFNEIFPAGKIPQQGLVVKNIATGEDVQLSAYLIGVFVITTIADFSDQRFSWQDDLLGNHDASMTYIDNDPGVLWPGDGRPGLWMSWSNRLATILKNSNIPNIHLPPIFNHFQGSLLEENEIKARDLYWKVIVEHRASSEAENAEKLLKQVITLNPFVGEPHVILSQIYIQKKEFQKAEEHSQEGLKLIQIWGSAWDKRISWEGWIAWCKVIILNAKSKTWPTSSSGIISLGLIH